MLPSLLRILLLVAWGRHAGDGGRLRRLLSVVVSSIRRIFFVLLSILLSLIARDGRGGRVVRLRRNTIFVHRILIPLLSPVPLRTLFCPSIRFFFVTRASNFISVVVRLVVWIRCVFFGSCLVFLVLCALISMTRPSVLRFVRELRLAVLAHEHLLGVDDELSFLRMLVLVHILHNIREDFFLFFDHFFIRLLHLIFKLRTPFFISYLPFLQLFIRLLHNVIKGQVVLCVDRLGFVFLWRSRGWTIQSDLLHHFDNSRDWRDAARGTHTFLRHLVKQERQVLQDGPRRLGRLLGSSVQVKMCQLKWKPTPSHPCDTASTNAPLDMRDGDHNCNI